MATEDAIYGADKTKWPLGSVPAEELAKLHQAKAQETLAQAGVVEVHNEPEPEPEPPVEKENEHDAG